MVIGRLISIEVLWESFHPNTPIKDELTLDCVHHLSDLIHHYLSYFLLSSHVCTFFESSRVSQSPI